MSRSHKEYLHHILDEIDYLLQSSNNLTEIEFSSDPTLQRAFSRSLEIIGEATKQLPKEFTNSHSDINWRSMAGMRDQLIHGYFGVDYGIVWDVIKSELPSLHKQITQLINQPQ